MIFYSTGENGRKPGLICKNKPSNQVRRLASRLRNNASVHFCATFIVSVATFCVRAIATFTGSLATFSVSVRALASFATFSFIATFSGATLSLQPLSVFSSFYNRTILKISICKKFLRFSWHIYSPIIVINLYNNCCCCCWNCQTLMI